MNISGIGVQQITPHTGTGWQDANPPPDNGNDADSQNNIQPKSDRAPAAPGTGQIVDKIA